MGYVYRSPDGLFVNAEIIRQGYGHVLTEYPFKHLEAFRTLESGARDAKRGLWSDKPAATKPEQPKPVAPAPAVVPVPLKADAPAAAPDVQQVTVYGTKTGSKYHTASCRYLSKSSIPMALKDAKAKGLTSRSVCHPPSVSDAGHDADTAIADAGPVTDPPSPATSVTETGDKAVHVREYYRKDGAYVQSHSRSAPRRE